MSVEKSLEEYHRIVEHLESGLGSYAKKSFENESRNFVDGYDMYRYFSDRYQTDPSSLVNRTPLQLERDRILYSHQMRKQTEKYHVLYNGRHRIVRNYTTHTMRMVQVTRAICSALHLNSDFAEAVAMGCKIGALPFIHASKDRIATWVRDKILEIDTKNLEHDKSTRINKEDQLADPQLALDFAGAQFPTWVTSINSSQTLDKVRRYIPWAAGSSTAHAYSSGQESYWLLCTNPYTVQALPKRHSPETMLGIWCHTRGTHSFISSFHHKMRLKEAFSGYHEITGSASTFEAIVVQYADDITWAIENMNDANAAALLNGQHSLYNEFSKSLENNIGAEQVPLVLATAITRYDAGGIYGFFIDDFIRYSGNILNQLAKQNGNRSALAGGNSLIGLSDIGERHLQEMIGFLEKFVFQEPRVKNRKEMLGVVSRACVDLLYQGEKEALVRRIDERGTVERWDRDQIDEAKKALDDPIHRVQLSIDVFAEMGDHEIYDYVGIETL